jgi:ABC-type transporter Mla subunit MlaD
MSETEKRMEEALEASLRQARATGQELLDQINGVLDEAKKFSDNMASDTVEKIESQMSETLTNITNLQAYLDKTKSEISKTYEKTAEMANGASQAMSEAESIREVAKRVESDVRAMHDGEKKITEAEERVVALVDEITARAAIRRGGEILKRRKGESSNDE